MRVLFALTAVVFAQSPVAAIECVCPPVVLWPCPPIVVRSVPDCPPVGAVMPAQATTIPMQMPVEAKEIPPGPKPVEAAKPEAAKPEAAKPEATIPPPGVPEKAKSNLDGAAVPPPVALPPFSIEPKRDAAAPKAPPLKEELRTPSVTPADGKLKEEARLGDAKPIELKRPMIDVKPDEPKTPPPDEPKGIDLKLPPIKSNYRPEDAVKAQAFEVDGVRRTTSAVLSIFNYTDREQAVVVDGKRTTLPARTRQTVDVPNDFVWSVGGRETTVKLAADSPGLQLVLR